MPARDNATLPHDLSRNLSQLHSHVGRLALVRGTAIVVVLLAAMIAAALLIDLTWELSIGIRLAMLAAVGLAGMVAGWLAVLRSCFGRLTSAELAALVEQSHPGLKERLSSTVELCDPNIPEAHKGSDLMRRLLAQETLASVARLDFSESVSATRAIRVAWMAAAAILLMLAPLVLFPSGYMLALSRFFQPWGNFDSVGNLILEVENGDRVVGRGTDVEIKVTPRRRSRWVRAELPETVWLNGTGVPGQSDSRRMEYDETVAAFTTSIPHVLGGFDYNVSAGRSRSRNYRIDVVEPPRIAGLTLDVEPPTYTGLPAETHDGVVGKTKVFQRSRLTFRIRFNKPMADVQLAWLDVNRSNRSPAFPKSRASDHRQFELAHDGRSATLQLTATQGGPFAIRLTDRHGLHNADEPRRTLVIIPDEAPRLTVAGSKRGQQVRPDDVVPVRVTATDDVGVGELELHYEISRLNKKGLLKAEPAKLGRREVSHEFPFDMAALGLPEGSVVTYRVRAADERPVPGPNEVWSDPRVLSLSRSAKPLGSEDVAERQQQWKQTLEAIRADLNKNRQQVADLHQRAEHDLQRQREFERNAEIPPLSQQQADLAGRLEQLATSFAEHPLFANLTEPTQQVARNDLADSQNNLKQAADSELREKTGQLKAAGRRLAQAEHRLGEIAKRFDELAEIERDLLQLNRLAKQAEQLAEQALALEQQRQNVPADLSPEQKQARERQLAEQQKKLEGQHQELTRQLNELLKRRPELVDAARQHELDRLAELSKQALRIAEPEDLLADALRSEAEQSANAFAPLAEKQKELVKQAEQLTSKADPQSQATPLDREALRRAVEALKAGNLQDAIQRQQAAAEELDRLARELGKNRQLPADPQQALKQLAKRQDNVQKRIAEAAQNTPPEDAPADRRDEFRRQLRPLAAEQAAMQAGIARLQVPARNRDGQQQSVKQAARAVDQLLAADPRRASQSAAETKKILEKLAEQIGSLAQRKAAAQKEVAELRQQQAELAKDVSRNVARRKMNKMPDPAAGQLAEKQADLARQLADVDAPGAPAEQRDAVRKSVAALRDLQQRHTEDVEASQAQAEQSLARLEKKLAGQPLPEEAVEQQRQVNDERDNLTKLADRDQRELAQAAERLADQQADLRKQSEQLADEQNGEKRAEAAKPLAEAQQQLRQQAERLPADREALQQADAKQHMQQAERALQGGDSEQAVNEQQQAEQALRDLAKRAEALAQAEEAPQADGNTQAANRQSAEQAAQLARQQRELQQQVAQLQQSRLQEPNPQPAANDSRQAGQPDGAPSKSQQVQTQQQEIAQQAAQLALDVARETGADSPSSKQAAQLARQAVEANRQALAGRLSQAGQTAREAANSAQQTARLLADPDQPAGANEPLGRRAEELASQQAQTADELTRLAGSPSQRTQAQQAGQQKLANAAQALASQLADAARKLNEEPLNLGQAGRQAEMAQQATDQGRRSMQQAARQLGRGDSGNASRQAERAAEALRQAARRTAQAVSANGGQQTPIPNDVGAQVAKAARNLQQARQQLAQAGKQAGRQQGQATGQLGQSAQSFKRAARALSQAAQTMAGQQRQGSRQDGSQAASSRAEGKNGGGTGAQVSVDLEMLESQLKKLSGRNWGQLPGHLRTEILQAARKKPNSDYAKLIKLYFREIATESARSTE